MWNEKCVFELVYIIRTRFEKCIRLQFSDIVMQHLYTNNLYTSALHHSLNKHISKNELATKTYKICNSTKHHIVQMISLLAYFRSLGRQFGFRRKKKHNRARRINLCATATQTKNGHRAAVHCILNYCTRHIIFTIYYNTFTRIFAVVAALRRQHMHILCTI